MQKIKVAAAQIKVTHDPDKNVLKILQFIDKAARKKVNIVCFPEACLINGWEKYQMRPIGKYLKRIKEKCKEKRINCIFGSFIKEKNKILNAIFFIDEKGKVRYRYEKIHLFKIERGHVKAGRQDIAINTKYGKIGIINCHDIDFPEFVKKIAKEGAWIIFCPTYDLKSKDEKTSLEIIRELPLIRASDDICYVVVCDASTKETTSFTEICSPEKILRSIYKKEGIIYADLDHEKIKKLRKEEDLLR